MFKSQLSLKSKLVLGFLTAGLIPLFATGFYSYLKSDHALKEEAKARVNAINNLKEKSVINYFDLIKNQALTLAHSHQTIKAFEGFKIGFNRFLLDQNYSPDLMETKKKSLFDFYQDEFSAEYKKQNEDKSINFQELFGSLNPNQLSIQAEYISENEHPLGSKHLLDYASGLGIYNRVHQNYHPNFREYLEKFEFYDIFLIDGETGNIIYSVFKELDFATSLIDGPYQNTGLAKAFKNAMEIKENDKVVMEDYYQYTPSYDGPAGFIASPIFIDGKVKGVIAFQISFDKINSYMLAKSGDEKMLESFLVGSDFKMRSDSTFDKINRNVRSSFRKPELGSLKTNLIKNALSSDNTVNIIANSYLGKEAVISAKKINILGINWIIETAYYTEEALMMIKDIQKIYLLILVISTLLISTFAIWFSSTLAQNLLNITKDLMSETENINKTSFSIAEVSTRLSEASTEQAASLQETVASIDEISAMVARNADNAESSAKSSETTTVSAQKGKDKVEHMIDSIQEIERGNENIIGQMQTSNREVSEIVKIIQDISAKTGVINDIVFQTKLLSFNASVEAARAGEHGKGFAVVAEEVGNLASMSGKAANEISEMLNNSVKKVTEVVNGTKKLMDNLVIQSKQNIEKGTITAKECAYSLDEILNNVSSVNEMVREISNASHEQSTGVSEVSEVNKAMSELDQVTQSNSIIANQSASSAVDLKSQAQRLESLAINLNQIILGSQTKQSSTHQNSFVENNTKDNLKKLQVKTFNKAS